MRVTDVPRLLGGAAPVAPPRDQIAPPPRPQPHQHQQQRVQPPHQPVQASADALGALLAAYNADEAEDFCTSIDQVRMLLRGALTDPAVARLSADGFWQRINGARLLALASRHSSCQTTLIQETVRFVTNVPGAVPLSFGFSSGLQTFCRDHAGTILRIMERADGGARDGFAARLPQFCPELFLSQTARVSGLNQILAQFLTAIGYGSHAELRVSRARAFSESVSFLNGPVANLGVLPVVRFAGESGTDAGGLRRDWFTSLSRLIFTSPSSDPAGGLFSVRPGTEYIQLNADRPFTSATRAHYTAVGRYLGMSLIQRLPIGVPLPRMFFRRLLNQAVTLDDVEMDDAELRRSLRHIETGGAAMIRDLEGLEADEDVLPVQEYIAQQLADIIPPSMNERLAAIREGFNAIVRIDSISPFVTPNDLRSLIYGTPEISVDDLIAHTTYDGRTFTASSPQIQWLWDWLRRSNNDVRRQFLRFVTGLSQLPMEGMAGLQRSIYITRSYENDLAPRSHTCSFALDMPVYRDATQLAEWMGVAVSSDGFGMA